MSQSCLAIDIGASSGRLMRGTLRTGKIVLEDIYRFQNRMARKDGHFYWDINHLWAEIIKGLRQVGQSGSQSASLGIDTWAVDYVLLDRDYRRLAEVYAYRDHRTDATMTEVFAQVAPEIIYAKTGIQFLQFNSIYQLFAQTQADSAVTAAAAHFLLIPDYLHYLLCGQATVEFTNATTTQLVNLQTGDWDDELIRLTGCPRSAFPPLIRPGTTLGKLTPDIRKETGLADLMVIAPATHDTGSAVAAVPAQGTDFAYISSGTWSLMGIESLVPINSRAALEGNFTNEGGVAGTYRILKNVMGLWLIQEAQRLYERRYSFAELVALATEGASLRSLINPNHPRFLNPKHMINEIQDYCRETGQVVPETPGAVSRCIFESLALQYRAVLLQLQALTGRKIAKLHIIGGGAQNKLLNQLCADFTECPVYAGPVEATVLGNMVMQWLALGEIGSLAEARAMIAASFAVEQYLPDQPPDLSEVWERFQALP